MPYTLSPASPELLPLDSQRGGENRWTLNFGPQHPATHTTLRLVLELDGERVVGCTPHIGYLHSGFEKLGEHLNYNQYVTIVDRMDYSAPIYNELAWHRTAEKLMGVELTPRCKVLRTIAGELGRIQSHLLCVGAAGLDLGAFTAFLYGWTFLFIINAGGIAAVAVTFARYTADLFSLSTAWIKPLGVGLLVILGGVNYFGVRSGSTAQNIFTVLKLVALAGVQLVALKGSIQHAVDE